MDGRAGRSGSQRRIAVVGGGIVGSLVALAFVKQGGDVVLIDRGSAEDRCSFGNAGSLSPGSVAPLGMPGVLAKIPGMLLAQDGPVRVSPSYLLRVLPWLSRFVLASTPRRVEQISYALSDLLSDSIELYGQTLKDLAAMDLMQRRGQLQLYPDEASRSSDAGVWNLRRHRGVVAEEVSRDDIQQLEPAVGQRYTCGIFLPNEGMVTNPARLVEVLTESFLRVGGSIRKENAVSFEGADGAASGVVTDRGVVQADHIVVAAGAWSNKLAREAGDHVPLETQRGYHLTLPSAGIRLSRPIVAADRKYFVSPMEIGIRVAGTVEFDSLDAPPHPKRIAALAASVPELLPDIDIRGSSSWMGHRPCLPDSLPVVDRSSRFHNVYYAFGNGHLGLTGAPKMAELIMALALDRPPAIDLKPFSARRFALLSAQTGASAR